MSMFSVPDEMKPDAKQMEKIAKDMTALMPREFAAAANMMVHPLAGAAAMSALGLGVASHAFGLWIGALAGSMDATRRLFELDMPATGGAPRLEDGPAFTKLRKAPSDSARSAVETLKADAGVAGPDPVSVGTAASAAAVVEQTAQPVARMRETTPERESGPADAKISAPLMPEDFMKPAAIEKPKKPDDLKAISGIGPKLEQVLNGLGVWTFAQVAAWSPAEIAWVDDYLSFKGRIGRDDWIGQAVALSAGKAKR